MSRRHTIESHPPSHPGSFAFFPPCCYTTSTMATKQQTYQDRIIIDPRILAGKPVVKGTRIPVELVLAHLAQDLDLKTLFAAYPHLTKEDVKACLLFSQTVLTGEGRTYLAQTKATN